MVGITRSKVIFCGCVLPPHTVLISPLVPSFALLHPSAWRNQGRARPLGDQSLGDHAVIRCPRAIDFQDECLEKAMKIGLHDWVKHT